MAASINEELERCKDWIEAALEYSGGTHEWSDIVEGIHSLRYQFWPAERGCAVTEIIVFPRKKIFHVFLAGGEMDQIVDMNDSAAHFAKAQGCDGMMGHSSFPKFEAAQQELAARNPEQQAIYDSLFGNPVPGAANPSIPEQVMARFR